MRWACAAALIVACGGPSTAPPSTTTPTALPVRVEATEPSVPRPVRVTQTLPGEAAESADLASPPPVEAPTGP